MHQTLPALVCASMINYEIPCSSHTCMAFSFLLKFHCSAVINFSNIYIVKDTQFRKITLLFSFIEVVIWSFGMGYSFGQTGSWLCPLPAFYTPPDSSLARQLEKQKSPWLSMSSAHQWLKIIVLSTLFPFQSQHIIIKSINI